MLLSIGLRASFRANGRGECRSFRRGSNQYLDAQGTFFEHINNSQAEIPVPGRAGDIRRGRRS